MWRKFLVVLLTVACALCLAFSFAGCKPSDESNNESASGSDNTQGETGGGKDEEQGGGHIHNFGNLIPEQPATCTEEGIKAHYYCGGCQKFFDSDKNETALEDLKIDIDLNAHNYGQLVPKKSATCTDEGLEAHYHCGDCDAYFDSEKTQTTFDELKIDIDPNAHKWGANGKCEYCQTQKPAYTERGNYIYMGEYPQSEVEESGLKTTLGWEASSGTLPTADNAHGWTDYNYYLSVESYMSGKAQSYMWYKDVEYQNNRYRGVYFTSYRLRYTVENNLTSKYCQNQEDNGYYVNTLYWFKYEPIEWRILDKDGNTALLMSNLILDSQHFYHDTEDRYESNTIYPNNYKESDIRVWLNDKFYNTAFDKFAKEIIQITEVDNSLTSTGDSSNNYVCENTNDKIFLLSVKEVTDASYGFNSDESEYDPARQLTSTAYAKSQGAYMNGSAISGYKGNGCWWLRSPQDNISKYPNVVQYNGWSDYYEYAYSTQVGIVPALRIKI